MDFTIEQLDELINSFLLGGLDGMAFEKEFRNIMDFEEVDFKGNKEKYYKEIREILERLTNSKDDLQAFPEYFIDSNELKRKIIALKTDL